MRKTKFHIEGIDVRGWRCQECGEEFLHPEDAEKALMVNKLKRGLTVTVGQLGKAKIIRLPQEIARFYRIKKGEEVEVKLENRRQFAVEVKK